MRAPAGVESIAWVFIILVMASLAEARPATLKDRANFRSGPSATAALLGELQAGSRVEVLGEEGGWRQVQTPDGQTGFVWAEHLAGESDTRPAAGRIETTAGADRTLAEQIRNLEGDVRVLRERPAPATAADLESVRDEVRRLTTTQEGLVRRLEQHPAGADPPPEPTPGTTPVLLFAAAVAGWVASRLTQRRRDHRQRDRLRL